MSATQNRSRRPDRLRTLGAAWALGLTALMASGPVTRAETLRVPQDFGTIQAALDAAQVGDTVLVSTGTYAQSVSLSNREQLTLRGRGTVVLDVSAFEVGIELEDCVDVKIDHLTITGASHSGVFVGESVDCQVKRVTVEGSGEFGVFVDDDSEGIAVERCRLNDVLGVGIFDASLNAHIQRNRFDGCGETAILLEGAGALIERHKLKGEPGIVVRGNENVIENNRIVDAPGDAIALGDEEQGADNVARGNRIHQPGRHGISAGGARSLVEGNRITSASNRGIVLLASQGGHQVQDNRLKRSGLVGIGSRVSTVGNTIDGNLLRASDKTAIRVMGDDVIVRDNRVISAGTLAVFVAGAGAQVLANHISRPGWDGLRVNGTEGSYEGNLIKRAGEHGIRVQQPDNALRVNTTRGSALFGLFDEVGGNTYVDNDFDSLAPESDG